MTSAIETNASSEQRQVNVVIGGLLLVLLLAALDSTIVATALPTIVREMGGIDHLSWVVTAYLLAQTVVTPLYGKFGDLYGRKRVVNVAIFIFLLGSALCGLARSMGQLIAFRAIQGLGGGGLMVTTQAAVGDIVPPRDRGRYQGIFGAVFGLSSIAGPLIGGYFTTHISWRWIFYINLPVGIIAVLVLAATFPVTTRRVAHSIDYIGAILLAAALSGIIVVTDLGGMAFPWGSGIIIGLIIASIAAVTGFIFVESRAKEPVVPLRLFTNKTFVISVLIGLIVGFALFGSVTYLPLFLQEVKGDSPTASGLRMLPMMGGMLISSIVSGQLISRRGRYKIFPIVGTLVMVTGLFMLSRVHADTSLTTTALLMLTLGLGLGMVMQVLVLAAQNAVDYRDLGVATSGATLFRLIGGSVGTAALGAVFAARLHRTGDFTGAMNTIFLIATVIGVFGFLMALALPERPLRDAVSARAGAVNEEISEVFPRPGDEEDCAGDERADAEKLAVATAKT